MSKAVKIKLKATKEFLVSVKLNNIFHFTLILTTRFGQLTIIRPPLHKQSTIFFV